MENKNSTGEEKGQREREPRKVRRGAVATATKSPLLWQNVIDNPVWKGWRQDMSGKNFSSSEQKHTG